MMMNELQARSLVAEEGLRLLKSGLVARTWGNVSCRIDEDHFVITPSGLGYEHMLPSDLVRITVSDGSELGNRMPSSEKGIHLAAYQIFSDVNYCIHTHQSAATIIGLTGWKDEFMTETERALLGGVAEAGYGRSGSKKLSDNVRKEMAAGAHVILMPHHGILSCGVDRDEAFKRALLLEQICRRQVKGQPVEISYEKAMKITGQDESLAEAPIPEPETLEEISDHQEPPHLPHLVQPSDLLSKDVISHLSSLPNLRLNASKTALKAAASRSPIPAQIDDMAQMIGSHIPVASEYDTLAIADGLVRFHAVQIPRIGILVSAEDPGDAEALLILTEKAAAACLHTRALHMEKKASLSFLEATIQHQNYQRSYSRRKSS